MENIVYTCSDDGSFQRFDCKNMMTVGTNRRHGAGVTCLLELDENTILTGSYDTTIKLWDIRKIS